MATDKDPMMYDSPTARSSAREIHFANPCNLGDDTLAALMNEAFADYLAGPARMDSAQMASFLKAGAVRRNLSVVAFDKEKPVGLLLVGCRRDLWRIATMGILPSHRKLGLGRRMLTQVIEAARKENCGELQLEVFERNTPAVALYRSLGFERRRHLHGWSLGGPSKVGGEALPCEFVAGLHAPKEGTFLDFPVLPWQNSPWGASLLQQPTRLLRTKDMVVSVLAFDSERPVLRSVFMATGKPSGDLALLLHSLRIHHPEKQWIAPALWPEEFDYAFESAGFLRAELAQLQMSLRPAHSVSNFQ